MRKPYIAVLVGLLGCDGNVRTLLESLDASTPEDGSESIADASMSGIDSGPSDSHVSPSEPPCTCADPDAACLATGPGSCEGFDPSDPVPACVHTTIVCNAITQCPAGYECGPGGSGFENKCYCTDPSICGVVCSPSGDCPCGLTCGAANRCIPCSFSNHCPTGKLCRGGECSAPPVSGTAPDGTSCATSSDCQGGSCTFRTCTQSCSSNADCTGGLICAESDNLENNGCVSPLVTSCEMGCTDPTDTCSLYPTPENYCAMWCTRELDCPGPCVADLEQGAHPSAPFLLYRVCSTGAKVCSDFEFEVRQGSSVSCSDGAGCLGDADCAAPYVSCLFSNRGSETRGVCTRQP